MHWLRILYCLFFMSSMVATCAFSIAQEPEPVERDHFVFYFDSPRYIDMADSVLNRTRARLQEFLQDTLSYKAKIYLVEDIDLFRKLIGGRFPDWGAAAAFPQRKLIAIKSPDRFNLGKSLEELLAHEYAHLVTAEKTGMYSAPRWFDEGLAMYVSMEWSWSDNLAMSRAAIFGDFLPLMKIEMVNRFNEGKAHVAYAESYLAVKYMLDNYGRQSLGRFLDELAHGKSLSVALVAVTGANVPEFEKEFHEYLTKHYNLATLFMDTMFFWLALAAIVVIATIIRYRKRRRYYKKWENEEKLQSTDFDYGDPDNPEQPDDDEPWRS